MKNFKLFAIYILLLVLGIDINAQDSEYKIFYSFGTIDLQQGDESRNADRDLFIRDAETLVISKNSFVVITNSKDIPMMFTDIKKYSVAEIEDSFKELDETILKENYYDDIANNMITRYMQINKNMEDYRAYGENLISPLDNAIIINDQAILKWENPKSIKQFLKIYETENLKEISYISLIDSTYSIKVGDNFAKGKKYAWTIDFNIELAHDTLLRVFTFADDTWKSNFNKKIQEIKNGENKLINKLIIIRLYLDQNVYPMIELFDDHLKGR